MIRGYFLCLILLFVGSLAHRGSHGGSHEEGLQSIGSFAKLISDFAKNLNFTQIEAVMDIVREQNLTKGQIRSEIEQWAASQSTELQQAFAKVESEIDALKKNLTDYFDGKALNLSTTAREFYDDYKEIFQSEDLTMKDECEAINNITSSITDSAVKRELEQVFGRLPRCPGFDHHHKKHFDDSDRGFGRFGNNGGNQGRQFGGFGQGQGSRRGSSGFDNQNGQGFGEGFENYGNYGQNQRSGRFSRTQFGRGY